MPLPQIVIHREVSQGFVERIQKITVDGYELPRVTSFTIRSSVGDITHFEVTLWGFVRYEDKEV